MKFMLLSAYYTIHLRPPLYLRNALPIDIKVSVAGCTVRNLDASKADEVDGTEIAKSLIKEDLLDYGEKAVNPGDVLHLPTVQLTGRRKEAKSYIVIRVSCIVLFSFVLLCSGFSLSNTWKKIGHVRRKSPRIMKNTQPGHFAHMTLQRKSKWISELGMDFEYYHMDCSICMTDFACRFQDRHGSLMLTVYSPFWMMNQTGLMLSYKVCSAGILKLYQLLIDKLLCLDKFRNTKCSLSSTGVQWTHSILVP